MSRRPLFVRAVLLSGVLIFPSVVTAKSLKNQVEELQARVAQIERVVESQALLNMLQRLDALEAEIQELRGQGEVSVNTLDGLKQRQRDLYLDIDRRLRQLEVGNVSVSPDAQVGGEDQGKQAKAAAQVTAEERKAYEDAKSFLKQGRYADAEKAFRDFLQTYPDSIYAGHAQYWLAESLYVRSNDAREFKAALTQFKKVVDTYPDSSKIADAKLKLGYTYYELKDWDQARDALSSLSKEYPNSSVARLAEQRLTRMKREGH